MDSPTPTSTPPSSTARNGPAGRCRSRWLGAAMLLTLIGLAAGCTPAQYQAWWTSQGNPPLAEPELSKAAASATYYWNEVARQNRFTARAHPISSAMAARMTPTSWRPGCPVPLSSLRHMRISYLGFDGKEHVGDMVVHVDQADNVARAFRSLWDARFPIERMRIVDDFGGDDNASMAANNTSAFNCRRVSGSSSWSQHAYGRAIDINPVRNPYVSGGTVAPPAGSAYLNRGSVRPGMLVQGGPGVTAFAAIGWGWGGNWSSSKDYQHVSANGR